MEEKVIHLFRLIKLKGDNVRFDHWTREQLNQLKADCKQLFGDQINAVKRLFKLKSDPILCDDLIENIAEKLYKVMQEQDLAQAEALIEKMVLSNLRYDVYLFRERNFSNFRMDLTFYNNHKTYDVKKIIIKNVYDLKEVLKLIMYVGKQYDKILKIDRDFELVFDEYTLMDGFENIIKVDEERTIN